VRERGLELEELSGMTKIGGRDHMNIDRHRVAVKLRELSII
jgi:hypothetical protein